MIISIDEAIKMLQDLKKNGQEYVMLSKFDSKKGVSYGLKEITIYNGIKTIQESIIPVEVNENSVVKSLKTMNEREIIKYLLLHK